MERTTIAVDLAKSVFQVAVSNRPGKTAETHRLRRPQLSAFFAQRPSSTVVMEACGSAHHWGRMFAAMGHQVVLLPPSQVHPYVRRNKTDSADAKALLEAVRNDIIRPDQDHRTADPGRTAPCSCGVAGRANGSH